MNPESARPFTPAVVLLLFAMALLFGAIAEDILSRQTLKPSDKEIRAWFDTKRTSTGIQIMLVTTELGGWRVIAPISTCVGLLLIRRRIYDWLVRLLVVLPGGMLFNVLLKLMFRRSRPVLDQPIVHTTSYSFPSGHTMAATLLYGFLVVFALSRVRSVFWRLAVFLSAGALVGLVGFSRIYLGAHYPSDVLGAFTAAVAWLALCFLI
jgi:membrane-associated phospholipid phosphatase